MSKKDSGQKFMDWSVIIWVILGFGTLFLIHNKAHCQEPDPWMIPEWDSVLCVTNSPNNPGIYAEDFGDEWVDIQGDTLIGFWFQSRFMVPSQGRAYRFTDCGISYEDVPDFGASPHSILPLPAYKDNNWQVPLIVGGILTSWLGGYYNGMGEGLATIEAYNRTSEGYHFRSSRSHFLRDQGTIGYAIGFSSIAIGMYQHESQLRKTSHNNDFWHSAKPLPTICRSLLISGITAGGSHLFAQWGYHRYVK